MSWSANQFMMVMLMVGVVCKADMIIGKYPSKLQKAVQWAVFVFIVAICGFSLDRGWPVHKDDVEDFVFISGVVQEPTEFEKGKVFIWVRIKDDPKRPYAIELDYDKELAKQVHLANLKSVLEGEMSIDMKDIVKSKEVKYVPVSI